MAQSPGKFGVLFVRARREPAVWESVLEGLRESIHDQLFEVDSIAKASDHVQLGWNGIIYLSLNSKEDLLQAANFLLHHQFEIKTEKTVRVGIFQRIDPCTSVRVSLEEWRHRSPGF